MTDPTPPSGWRRRLSGMEDAALPEDARQRIVTGTLVALGAVPVLLAAAWVWPVSFEVTRFGRDVGLAVGGSLLAAGGLALSWIGTRRALQGFAMGRPGVEVTVSGHRRLRSHRRTGAGGADDPAHYLRLDVPGRRPVAVRVDGEVAARFRVPTVAVLRRIGPALTIEVADDVLHLRNPARPVPSEIEPL